MKNVIRLFLIFILCLIISGCVAPTVEEEENNYVFNYLNEDIILGDNMSNVLSKFNDYIRYKETESCAFQGLDKVYIYEHFEIYTYPNNEEDFVWKIYLLDNTVSTQEGLTINDSYDKMIELYGNNFTLNGTEYIYKKGNTSLSFIINNDKVIQILYTLEV